MPRVLTCTQYDESTQTCNENAWQEQPSLLPQMTVEQGKEIGHALLVALISVAVLKAFLNPKLHRSSKL